mmetsp:Transcript_21053/g.40059  ORF Transcript_21053/g.40059 Transcript_21053/m.40059 type:complete len:236 (+) Transcript_21053:1146-1853(+)
MGKLRFVCRSATSYHAPEPLERTSPGAFAASAGGATHTTRSSSSSTPTSSTPGTRSVRLWDRPDPKKPPPPPERLASFLSSPRAPAALSALATSRRVCTSWMTSLSCAKEGRLLGSVAQQQSRRLHISAGMLGGGGSRRLPSHTPGLTWMSAASTPCDAYGGAPIVATSHSSTPKDQTSDFSFHMSCAKLSGAMCRKSLTCRAVCTGLLPAILEVAARASSAWACVNPPTLTDTE